MRLIWERDIFKKSNTKKISPPIRQASIFKKGKPAEVSRYVFPLKRSILPAKVQTKAASKSKARFETFKFIEFNVIIILNLKRASH